MSWNGVYLTAKDNKVTTVQVYGAEKAKYKVPIWGHTIYESCSGKEQVAELNIKE